MSDKMRDEQTDNLFRAVLSLNNIDECYAFFEDLCSIPELKAMGQRFEVAKLLNEDVTYHSISAITKASTATISRVNRSLIYGCDAYQMVFERMSGPDDQDMESEEED